MKHSGSGGGERELAALAARYDLPEGATTQLKALLTLVVSDDTAPTTVRDPIGVLRDHLADSLIALDWRAAGAARSVADLGAGAGFPGLPLAIGLPASTVSLVESNGHKCEFMARAIEVCEIPNAVVVRERAESWADGIESCDLITARALAPLAVVAEYAAPLLRVGGSLLAWRGRRESADEAQGARAAAELGLEPGEPIRVDPYPGALHRHLHPMVKVAPTPGRFPRRPGMARKRPLGGASDRRRR